MENKRYSVILFSENQIGLMSQFSNIFTRRNLSIWSLLALPTDIKGIHSITIVTDGSEKKIREAVLQLEKRVDVLKAFHYPGNLVENRDEELYYRSLAKVKEFVIDRELERKRK